MKVSGTDLTPYIGIALEVYGMDVFMRLHEEWAAYKREHGHVTSGEFMYERHPAMFAALVAYRRITR